MDIKKTLDEILAEQELSTNAILGGGYPVKIGARKFGVGQSSNSTPETFSFFSASVRDELIDIYSQVYKVAFMWTLRPESDSIIQQDEWLKKEYLDQGYDLPSLREELGGMIHILPFDDLLNDKSHVFWLNSDLETYYPFDVHYNLTACLRRVNGVVENKIYIYHNRIPKVFDMNVTLAKYLELAYKAKAFYNWPMAYINRSGMDWEKMKRILPRIFPHLKLDLQEFGM